MRLLKLIITLLALLGAAYFTFYVPLGDERTLGSHIREIASSDEAKQLGLAVEKSVIQVQNDLAVEVGKVGTTKQAESGDKPKATSRRQAKAADERVAPETTEPNTERALDRNGLTRLISKVVSDE